MNKANRAFEKALKKDLASLEKRVIELKKEYDKSNLANKIDEFNSTMLVVTKSGLAKEMQWRNEEFIARNVGLSQEMDMLRLFIRVYNNEIPVFDDFVTLEQYIDRYSFSESDKADIIAFFLNKYYIFINSKLDENYGNLVKRNIMEEAEKIDNFPPKRALIFHRQWTKFHEDRKNECRKLSFFRKLVLENGELVAALDAITYRSNLLSLNVGLTENQAVLLTEESLKRALKLADVKHNVSITTKLEEDDIINEDKNRTITDAKRSLNAYLTSDEPTKYLDENAQRRVFDLMNIIGYTPKRKATIKRNILENNKKIVEEYNKKNWEEAQMMFLSEKERSFLNTVIMSLESDDGLHPYVKKHLYDLLLGVKNQLIYCYRLRIEGNLNMNDDGEYLILLLQELAENFDIYIGTNYKQVLGLK